MVNDTSRRAVVRSYETLTSSKEMRPNTGAVRPVPAVEGVFPSTEKA
jgi:hypothetical protein